MNSALNAAQKLYQAGDLFAAYDRLGQHFETQDKGSSQTDGAGYLETLLLVGLGNPQEALRAFKRHNLAQSEDLDSRILEARIWKEIAYSQGSAARTDQLKRAQTIYRFIGRQNDDFFPLINAATLSAILGNENEARALADRAMTLIPDHSSDYWAIATKLEALAILGENESAGVLANEISRMDSASPSARASTIRQLLRLANACSWSPRWRNEIIDPLRPSPVLVFSGHIFLNDEAIENRISNNIDALLVSRGISIGYGSLAAGSDILFAEALLQRSGELNIILPFDTGDFCAVSVDRPGGNWKDRFEKCSANASKFSHASNMVYVDDDNQFAYGSRVAMGMAKLRAEILFTKAIQAVVWDEIQGSGTAGTAADVAQWQNLGGETIVLNGKDLPRCNSSKAQISIPKESYHRSLRALIFTDFPGFSKLSESQLPIFQSQVMERCAPILNQFSSSINAQNSWGDALFVVLDDPVKAAELCSLLQKTIGKADFSAMGISELSNMRFAIHYGPVFECTDPLLGRSNFFGNEVNRAARLEPCTPPGAIYVTEPFAAALCLRSGHNFKSNYVGEIELAKHYGRFPIYQLNTVTENIV